MRGASAPLVAALAEVFGLEPAQLHPEAELEADLAIDSLGLAELQVVLEERLGVRIDLDDPAAVHTIGDLQRVIDAAVARGLAMPPTIRLKGGPA